MHSVMHEWRTSEVCVNSPEVVIFSLIKLLLMSLVHVSGEFFLVGDS